MSWMKDIEKSIKYIEENIMEDISIDDIAREVNLSPFYFQRGFTILCGVTPSEYIRNRRLSLAGRELQFREEKVIDIALKYCYDSPDSFTKAFTRFHGVTPNEAKSGRGNLKFYLPLCLRFEMKGGFEMEFKVVKKPSFTVVGYSKTINYEEGYKECPKFWDEHFMLGRGEEILGKYGLCIDEGIEEGKFKYLIVDDYVPSKEYPNDVETYVIPEHIWGIFPCVGPIPAALQGVNTKIFKDWLPNNSEYEIAGGYNIELYTDPREYPKGNQDENFYCEIWIPLKIKK